MKRLSTIAWTGGDIIAVGGIAGSLLGFLPPLAAFIAIVWYLIQIYESATLQKLLKSYRLQKLVKLRAQATALELLIRDKNTGVTELNEANKVHAAAIIAQQMIYDKLPPETGGREH